MAPSICIEDPIGTAPTNPTGKGARGLDEAKAFWDANIGPNTIRVETHESFVAANESAHVLTLTTLLANGMTARVHGIFTYRVNDAGKLEALRGFWGWADLKLERAK